MSAKQDISTPTVRAIVTLGATLRPMAVNSDGLHYRITDVKRLRPALGNHWPIHQDGTFCAITQGREDRGRPSKNICQRNLEISRTPHGHCIGSGLPLHLGSMERMPAATGNPAPNVNSISPTNGRTNGTTQSDH